MIHLIKKKELGLPLTIKEKNLFNFIKKEKQKKMCKEDHIFGYAPHVKDGMCRFCRGYKERSLEEILRKFKELKLVI